MKASTRGGKWKCPPDELSGQKKAAQPDQATKNGATRRVVWPEGSNPTRASHKKRCHKQAKHAGCCGRSQRFQNQAIKNGVTDKPSALAAVADSKDPKFPHQKHKRDLRSEERR